MVDESEEAIESVDESVESKIVDKSATEADSVEKPTDADSVDESTELGGVVKSTEVVDNGVVDGPVELRLIDDFDCSVLCATDECVDEAVTGDCVELVEVVDITEFKALEVLAIGD